MSLSLDLDESWVECLSEFKTTLASLKPTWSCYTRPGEDKETMLSALEVMDCKTDPGCGYAEVQSLNSLLKDKSIPSAANLQGQALLDVMDIIHMKELQYLEGYSLTAGCLSFPYFFRMSILKEQNITLHAYCRAVTRSIEMAMRAVMTTRIRSDEEFVPWINELNREEEISEEQILSELEEAACKAESPAIAARLRWRKKYLSALQLFNNGMRKSDTEAACDICHEALEILNSCDYKREEEPVQDNKIFREKEVVYWASAFTPTKPRPTIPFTEAMKSYKVMLEQLISLKDLLNMPTLQTILEFVEALGAQTPLLPMRAIAVIVLFRHDPSESFLHGPSLLHRILEELSTEYGAPLYLKIYEGDEELLEAVVKYRIHKTMDPVKITPEQHMLLRQQTLEFLRRWVMEMSKVYLIHIEAMLCNRGLAHRRLMNCLPQLGSLQEMAYNTDTNIFLSMVPSVSSELETEIVRRMPLLAMYVNQHILHVMELIFSLTVELNLFTQGEFIPALWYLNFTQRAQMENLALLAPPTSTQIPETRINRRTKMPLHNLVLTTRTSGHSDNIRLAILEAGCMLADAIFISMCAMESKGLIDLTSPPKYSLISVENVFNHRMKCLQHIRSPPYTPYKRCLEAKLFFEPEKIPLYSRKAAEIGMKAAERLRQILNSNEISQIRRRCLQNKIIAMEKTARAAAASLAAFASVCEEEENNNNNKENGKKEEEGNINNNNNNNILLKGYTVAVERPFDASMMCLAFRRRENS